MIASSVVALRAAGWWLVAASGLLFAGLVFHGPIAPEIADQMVRISDGATRWIMVHWMAAAGLSSYAASGLIVLTSDSRLTQNGWSLTGWAVLTVGALWTATTAVAEATVVADAAVAEAIPTFEAWWAFSEGKATGFAFMALAVALIAANERSPASPLPNWMSALGIGFGVLSFGGWSLGVWIGIDFGNLLWVISSALMTLWTLAFGMALARTPVQEGGPDQAT